jgi:oligoendopeptidase F
MPQSKKTASKNSRIKTEWDLTLLYKSEKDPLIQKDLEAFKKQCENFEKKYKNKTDWLSDENALLKALKEYESMLNQSDARPLFYYYYRRDLNSEDKTAEAQMNKLSTEFTQYANKLVFFSVSLGTIEIEKKKAFLQSEKLKHYHYFLKVLFDRGDHMLSEGEEKVLNLKSLPAHEMWVNATEKFENSRTVKFEGKEIPLPEALEKISGLPMKKRHQLHKIAIEKLKEVGDFAEAEINAIYTDKKISDMLRDYKEPYSATVLGYENDEKTVMNLVDTVTRRFDISRRFYNLKKKLLKVSSLEYSDRSASIGDTKEKISFNEAYQMLQEVFAGADPEFKDILVRFVENGQVDAFPKPGKTGGAYCSGSRGNPTFLLLNHIDNFKSYMTFAHETGHGIHTELSKNQPALYSDYVTSAAEVASTLMENFAFEYAFERLAEKDKIVALHDRIDDAIATIFRQIACFNFELELHRTIREKGSMSKEEIAALMNKNMKAYIGPAMKFTEEDGYFFVSWSHIRRFFYVYSYAYGHLISSALYRKYKADPSYMKEIKKFLSAGGSMSPDDIFKLIGINTRDPKFFEEGLKQIEEDIKRLEKLTK